MCERALLRQYSRTVEAKNSQQERRPSRGVRFDAALIRRYDNRGPRYTSYPTALQFDADFGADDYRRHVRLSNDRSHPLSLYVHIPFCKSLCYYCGCNKVVTRNQERIQRYLHHLYLEIEMQAALFDRQRTVEQLHLGGGTPTYLDDGQLAGLMTELRRHFSLQADERREFSVEVDPRTVGRASVSRLRELGFNRLSLGIQDFDSAVQIAVNRLQSADDVAAIVQEARDNGFKSISFDLIYGLPHQTVASFDRTLRRVIEMRPDRLAIYNYAHLPDRFKGQRMIRDSDLPRPAAKLQILHHTIDKLQDSGYRYIGMDHFALASDDLAVAQERGTLQRNFQGYSTHGGCDLIALGASGIGRIGDAFAQNATSTTRYEELIGSGRLAIDRGVETDADDRLRAAVIQELMCHEILDIGRFEQMHGVDFNRYFEAELRRLGSLEKDGLVQVSSDRLCITPRGRLLLRSIAMIFDRYLPASGTESRFSRAI